MPSPTHRVVLAASVLCVALTVAVGLTATPAAADPPMPTDFESRVLGVEPPSPGVSVEVQGGDAFLTVTVARGHTVTVPDYGTGLRPPYLRFLADGTVQVNETSAAFSANRGRNSSSPEAATGGVSDDPVSPSDDSDPRWVTVAHDGRYAWHDHRIHLMVPEGLAQVDAHGRVDLGGPDGGWQVPLIVDGTATTVSGELVRHSAPRWWPWALLGIALFAGTVLAVTTARPRAGVALMAAQQVVAAAALYLSVRERLLAPPGAAPSPLVVGLTAVASAAAAVALLARRRSGTPTARRGALVRSGTAAAAATLGVWTITRLGVFTHALVPTGLPLAERATGTLAAAVTLAAMVTLVTHPHALLPPAEPGGADS